MERIAWAAVAAGLVACGSGAGGGGGAPDDGGWIDDASADARWPEVDGSYVVGDAGAIRADRFATKVASFTKGDCGGFGSEGAVLGPPIGGGACAGSLDVLSLGGGGEIVLSFEPNAVVDGPGTDFVVFENPFGMGCDPTRPDYELGEVSVSDDGASWTVFPCTAIAYPFGACAGWSVVYSNPTNQISPVDPKLAGGDAFDLAAVGVKRARYVKVRDLRRDWQAETCSGETQKATNEGFDLDAVAIVNAENP